MSLRSRFAGSTRSWENWLLLLGIVAIVVSLAIAREELAVYGRETQLLLAGYIALQVAGWLAVLEWYRSA